SREEPVNVRILSATHQKRGELVARGESREDLYYRINVIEVHVPPLRERGDDVLLLADDILRRLGSALAVLDGDAKAALLRHPFPGNVRELENVLERAVTLCAGGRISESDLNLEARQPPGAPAHPSGSTALGDQLEDVQRQAIIEALEKTRYNKTQAAK